MADDALYNIVEHPTRLLHCETSQGIIHLTKHIKPDALVIAADDGQPSSELQSWALHFAFVSCVNPKLGWVGKFILVDPKLAEGGRFGLVQTAWPEGVTFEDLLFSRGEEGQSQ